MNKPIARVTLSVSDQERAFKFYTQAFGMTALLRSEAPIENWRDFSAPAVDEPSSNSSLIDSGNLIELHISQRPHTVQSAECAGMTKTGTGPNRLIIAVGSMQKTANEITAAGGTVASLLFDIDPGNPTHAIAEDPDGNVIELAEAANLLQSGEEAMLIGLGLTTPNPRAALNELCCDYGFSPGQDEFNHTLVDSCDDIFEQSWTITRDGMYIVLYPDHETANDNNPCSETLRLALTAPGPGTDSTDQQP
jgi:predicted enzyme related to lactoylglutathione lyase